MGLFLVFLVFLELILFVSPIPPKHTVRQVKENSFYTALEKNCSLIGKIADFNKQDVFTKCTDWEAINKTENLEGATENNVRCLLYFESFASFCTRLTQAVAAKGTGNFTVSQELLTPMLKDYTSIDKVCKNLGVFGHRTLEPLTKWITDDLQCVKLCTTYVDKAPLLECSLAHHFSNLEVKLQESAPVQSNTADAGGTAGKENVGAQAKNVAAQAKNVPDEVPAKKGEKPLTQEKAELNPPAPNMASQADAVPGNVPANPSAQKNEATAPQSAKQNPQDPAAAVASASNNRTPEQDVVESQAGGEQSKTGGVKALEDKPLSAAANVASKPDEGQAANQEEHVSEPGKKSEAATDEGQEDDGGESAGLEPNDGDDGDEAVDSGPIDNTGDEEEAQSKKGAGDEQDAVNEMKPGDEAIQSNLAKALPEKNSESVNLPVPDFEHRPVSYKTVDNLDGDSYFFSYFMAICALFVLGYVGYHNRQKVMALVLEGKRGKRQYRGRRPNSANYHKLDSNLEEAISSSCTKNSSHVIY